MPIAPRPHRRSANRERVNAACGLESARNLPLGRGRVGERSTCNNLPCATVRALFNQDIRIESARRIVIPSLCAPLNRKATICLVAGCGSYIDVVLWHLLGRQSGDPPEQNRQKYH
jgi:hypothetical protein